MKTTGLLITVFLAASAFARSQPRPQPEIQPVPGLIGPDGEEIPEPEVQVETHEYERDLSHLCPNAPSEEATQCVASYNLSQNVQHELVTATVDAPDHLSRYGDNLKLTECSIEKIVDPQMSLEVFCYFKGIKESLFKEFEVVESKEEFRDLMRLVNQKIRDAENPSYVNFLKELRDQLKVRFNIVKEELEVLNSKGYVVSESYDHKIDLEKYQALVDDKEEASD